MTTPGIAPSSHPPTATTSRIHGRFLWHELLARDIAAAQAFYPKVVGWTMSAMPLPQGGAYTIFEMDGMGRAGAMQYPAEACAAGAPARWVPYMGSDDVDATCRAAAALGATIQMPPTDMPEVGRMAMLHDPEKAPFYVFKPIPAGTLEQAPVAGEFAWHELASDDPERALDFYQRLFGWERLHAMDMGTDGMYQMFGRGAFTYGGMMRRSAGMPAPTWSSYIRVADLDRAMIALKEAEGKIVMGPHEVPNDDLIVVAEDNQGAVISFVGTKQK